MRFFEQLESRRLFSTGTAVSAFPSPTTHAEVVVERKASATYDVVAVLTASISGGASNIDSGSLVFVNFFHKVNDKKSVKIGEMATIEWEAKTGKWKGHSSFLRVTEGNNYFATFSLKGHKDVNSPWTAGSPKKFVAVVATFKY